MLNHSKSLLAKIFDDEVEMLSSVTELFELQLAYMEYGCLQKDVFWERCAYFKSRDAKLTKHYALYSNVPHELTDDRTTETKNYFEQGSFATGYATHGLFPYRGKFHPQLIKAILNIIGIRKGEVVLDPMAGSGTLNIEAALNGIDSFAVDVSPFCRFMIKVKFESLTLRTEDMGSLSKNTARIFEMFHNQGGLNRLMAITDPVKKKVGELCLLAYLDALGYSKRVKMNDHERLFQKVISRYIGVVNNSLTRIVPNVQLGSVSVLETSLAQKIDLPDSCIDGIITSPPYSFAIDYVENDAPHIEYLGYDVQEIRNNMVGLKGKSINEKLELYFSDMDCVLKECSRVLKQEKYLVMVIGSNTNQTKGVYLEPRIIKSAQNYNFVLDYIIKKPIKGLRNTMKEELVLFFIKRG